MPYTDRGYVKKTEQDYISEKEEEFVNLFGIVNNSVSDVMWQWFKNLIYERMEIENIHEIGSYMMSISNAIGVFLDKWGEECGIKRKSESKASGYVEVTYPMTEEASYTIPKGTVFSSATNSYSSTFDMIVPYAIVMTKTKTGESEDYFPTLINKVDSISKITDINNVEIDSGYYDFDEVYYNNIQWHEDSDEVLIKGEQYYVYFYGDVTVRVPVASDEYGIDSNSSANSVTSCDSIPSLDVTNSNEITGGSDEETDDNYRKRLIQARRRTFTLDNIKSIILGTTGVRACKVHQTIGTDQTSVDDWDNPTTGETLSVSGTIPSYSQGFVPGDHIATLGRITLRGRPVNDPPGLYIGIKPNYDDWVTGVYYDYNYIEKHQLDQSKTGWWDIPVDILYNGLDKTKSYRFDVWCKDPENPTFDWATNYWDLVTSTEQYRTDDRGMLYVYSDSGEIMTPTGNSLDLMFKTQFNGAGYEAIIAPDDGFGYDNLLISIKNSLDYIDGGGYAPICIQPYFYEADDVAINIKVVVYISDLAIFQIVSNTLQIMLDTYFDNLEIGSFVIYSRIWQVIMNHVNVVKLKDLYIQRESGEWVQIDIGIEKNEIPILGTLNIQQG